MPTRALPAMIAGISVVLSALVPVTAYAAQAPASGAKVAAITLLDQLPVAAESTVKYNRDLFAEGLDLDGNGCRTRNDLLVAEGTDVVTSGCTVTGGTWYSYYDNTSVTDPSKLEMDHVVALAESWRSGAWNWTDSQRAQYANDVTIPETLNLVTSASNQAKSDKDPAKWMPSYSGAHCRYAAEWVTIKYRWNLSVDSAEKKALAATLGSCATGAATVTVPAKATTPTISNASDFATGTTRLEGANRYDTAAKAAQKFGANVPVVFVATGAGFPDALSAAAAAAHLGGPLLLTKPTSLPSVAARELARLKPQKIVVVGGTGAVSNAVSSSLKKYSPKVERWGGANRYDTSRLVMEKAFPTATAAYVATGRSFPDALSATGVAGLLNAPVLLVNGTQSSVAKATLSSLKARGVTTTFIAGGTGAVSSSIEKQLKNAGFAPQRRGGANRYETSVVINRDFAGVGASTLFLAVGSNFPDALAGSALAGNIGAPMYLTSSACTPAPVHDAIASAGASSRVVMGGTKAVSAAAAKNTGCLSAATPTISGSAQVSKKLTAKPGGWTSGTTFSYQWYAGGKAISGATAATLTLGTAHAGKAITVKVTGKKSGWTTVSKTSKATAKVGYPSSTAATSSSCPAWAPIKGNASSMIYHVPGGQFYDRTNPEECFRTEAAARAAGYRASQR